MLLEPFYTESNWTTKNQVLAYQKKLFVNADTHVQRNITKPKFDSV